MIRHAEPRDLEAIVGLARRFTEESGLPVTFNAHRARATAWQAIHDPEWVFLVDEADDVIAGVAMLTFECDWYDEILAYVAKFYVEKEFRPLGTAQALVRELVAEAENRGARMVFASATAGMGERVERAYVRLFERAGFQVLGRIISKEL